MAYTQVAPNPIYNFNLDDQIDHGTRHRHDQLGITAP